MHLGYRIKASDEFADIQALEFVGGRMTLGPYPKFVFNNEVQYGRYDEVRRRIKGGESLESIARSYQVSGGASGVPETSAETREH